MGSYVRTQGRRWQFEPEAISASGQNKNGSGLCVLYDSYFIVRGPYRGCFSQVLFDKKGLCSVYV